MIIFKLINIKILVIYILNNINKLILSIISNCNQIKMIYYVLLILKCIIFSISTDILYKINK